MLVYVNFDYTEFDIHGIGKRLGNLTIRSFDEVWLIASHWTEERDGFVIGKVFPEVLGPLPFHAMTQTVITEATGGTERGWN